MGPEPARLVRIPPAALASVPVLASPSFASLAAASGAARFECQYVGRVPLAKQYGTFPMFHVRPVKAVA